MAENYRKYLDPQTLSKLQGLEIKARLIVEGFVSGLHKSPYHGFSIEFAEHREYVPGDDLRHVDWKVFGRSDRFYLKQYEEETNFACHILLDTSESMRYRSEQAAMSKLEYAQHVAAAIAYLVLQQRDAAGLATYDDALHNFIRASSHPSQIKQLCHVMEQNPAVGESAMGPIFHEVAERIKKRGLVLILSDLFDDVTSLMHGLKHLRYRRHEVIVLHTIDPAEQDFPFEDPTLFKGLEGLPEQLTEPRVLRAAYQEEFEQFLHEVRKGCRDMHMDYMLLRTDQPLNMALSAYLAGRSQHMHKT
ncbi:hypothetical protein Pan258_11480 [Symmachiella dynata]|uniref:DUF58 domain-containing protein n=1 Tax=Symmachiella dynata TaxID=2527995 RepID=UPI00118D1499|nr:DUF58 domain-containing protein [Symmachiella dynata]QDT47117.1 hypothetical protein Pan258_11480 [Symmachiella dynata]